MSVTTFPHPVYFVTTLKTTHTSGAGTLILQTGDGARIGSLGANEVYAVTTATNPGPGETNVRNFLATGLSTDTLTGVTVDADSSDATLAAGTSVQVRVTKYWMGLVQTAINTLETAMAGTGTVTSVAMTVPTSVVTVSGSPVTTSGTLALSLATQSANRVWAGPTTGSAATPTFRALVAADVPTMPATVGSGTSGRIPYETTAGLLIDSARMAFDGSTVVLTSDGTNPSQQWKTSGGSVRGAVLPDGCAHFGSGAPSAYIGVAHTFEIIASGVLTPLTLIGGSGVIEYWKDATPSIACMVGLGTNGTPSDNVQFSTYNPSSGWVVRGEFLNADGTFHVAGHATVDGMLTAACHAAPTHVDADASTVTFNLSVSDWHRVTLGGNRTLAVSNETVDQQFTIVLKQDGTGSRTVTWWSGILWDGGAPPTLTTTAGHRTILTFKVESAGVYLGMVAVQDA